MSRHRCAAQFATSLEQAEWARRCAPDTTHLTRARGLGRTPSRRSTSRAAAGLVEAAARMLGRGRTPNPASTSAATSMHRGRGAAESAPLSVLQLERPDAANLLMQRFRLDPRYPGREDDNPGISNRLCRTPVGGG